MNERGISRSDGSRGSAPRREYGEDAALGPRQRKLRRATKQGDADSAMIAAGGADTKCLNE